MQHCGVCTAIADMVRRIMCLKGSRRGSGESSSSCHQALNEEEESSRGDISIDRTDPNVVLFRMTGPLQASTHTRRLSEADWLLLETLDTRCIRPLHTGRFLTMHKRRRKRLTTRSLQQDPGLLDDIQHGQVQCLLNRVWQWPFNAFSLDAVTGGRSLPVLCVHLFHWYGLLDHFNLDVVRVWKLFTLIEEGYHGTNPYHNSIHATDVTQAMHCFLQETKIRQHLTPLEIMSSLVAAVTHDLDHPGVNQPFLIATSNHLAALYENTSVLENHHWRSAMGCLIESDMAEQLGSCRPQLSSQISSLILATDITRQQEFLTRFKRYMDQGLLDMRNAEHRHFILQIALKCADISNPCRPWDISKKWSQKVCEEFFRQGDYERQLHLPVTSLCDRQSTSVCKIQSGFFRFVVAPLFEEWHRFLNTELSSKMMKYLNDNKERWDTMVQHELAEETRTEISEADLIEEGNMSTDDEAECEDLLLPVSPTEQRRPSLPLEDTDGGQRVGRRHSVPLSLTRPPSISRTIIRRESLPVGEYRTQRRFPSGPISEEVDLHLAQSSLSLASSCSSSGLQHLSTFDSQQENRPVSAESLLPEPSIASITTSLEASRLGSVLHGVTKNPLTRQQTFPPLAPSYMRHRYMSSAGADITEAISSSSSDSFILSKQASTDQNDCSSKPTKANPFLVRDSTNRSPSAVESCIGSGKREQSDSLCRDKGTKIAKLSDCATSSQQRWEKENMDPRYDLDVDGSNNKLLRRTLQGLARRRGSAPVGLVPRDDVTTPLAQRATSDRLKRRGSVPIDVTRQRVKDKSSECLERLEPSGALWSENSNFPIPWHRRRSIPFDSNVDPCRSEVRVLSDTNGGKSRSRRKRELHRRKSGGPEMFSHTTLDSTSSWQRWLRRPTEPMLSRRRGSLPLTLAGATQRMSEF